MLVFVHFYKMNTLFKYFKSLPVGLNTSVKSLYIEIIVAESGAQCSVSVAYVFQYGQHRAVASLVILLVLQSLLRRRQFNLPSLRHKTPWMSYSCNN